MLTTDRNRTLTHVFLIAMVVIWMIPLVGMVVSAFRPFAETATDGFFSWPNTLTLDNFRDAYERGNMGRHWIVTFAIVIPSVVIVLFLSSMVAFAVSRYSWPG